MKTILTIILLICQFVGLSQFSREKALYNFKGGLIFQNKKLIIPKDNYFILEQYEYGGGIFNSNPYRDTLVLRFDTLIGKEVKFYKNGKKYFEIYRNKKRRVKFIEVEICDSLINVTRNRTYKYKMHYQLGDSISKYFGRFHDKINFGEKNIYSKSINLNECNEIFKSKIDSIYKESLISLNKEYLNRAILYSDFLNSKNKIDKLFVRTFLINFVSCEFDQNIFYKLLLNNSELMFYQIDCLSDSEYRELVTQIIGMPTSMDSKIVLQKIQDFNGQFIRKDKFTKDVKMFWR